MALSISSYNEECFLPSCQKTHYRSPEGKSFHSILSRPFDKPQNYMYLDGRVIPFPDSTKQKARELFRDIQSPSQNGADKPYSKESSKPDRPGYQIFNIYVP